MPFYIEPEKEKAALKVRAALKKQFKRLI